MDKLRIYVWIALAAMLYIAYMTWQRDYPPQQPVATTVPAPEASANALPPLPVEAGSPPAAAPATNANDVPTLSTPTTNQAPVITVRTDVLEMSISLLGGQLQRADLLKYPDREEPKTKVTELFNTSTDNYFVARSGLRAVDEKSAPTHQALYTSEVTNYDLRAGEDTLVVPLTWKDSQGVTVTKIYTFKRGSYVIDLEYSVDNKSATDWSAASYMQLTRRHQVVERSMFNAETYAFMGPAVYDGKSIHNLKLNKEENRNFNAAYTGGWIAAMQHHFVVAAVPTPDQPYDYQLNVESPQQFTFTYRGPLQSVAAGANGEFHETLFVGPKLQTQLKVVGSNLELTADYGMLTIICKPLFLLLSYLHGFIGNWGWSIILVTFLIKLVFYKLTEASGKSMAKMREMAPRLKALQERYKDDREQLGRATMEFYKREKINPLAGCLPMLVQMPVWMAFYWVILNSAEMRNAPFIGYLTDLSTKDPYFILPLILGVVNFMQFKLNPAPADPVQAKVMMMMPIGITVMMAWFPSGLALYWITNTGLSILQQWHINRVVAAAAKKS